MNSAVSNMRLYCSSIAKIIPFKTFDGESFWVKNAKKVRFLAFERFDKNALISYQNSNNLTMIYGAHL